MVKIKITNIKIGPKERLLKYLIENKNPVSINHVSGAILVDYKNTHNLVNTLVARGVIVKGRIGNTSPIRINLVPNIDIYDIEKKRTQEFVSKNPKLNVLRNYIEELNYPFLIVLVFGSYVKETNNVHSDIDICVIVDNEDKSKELWQKLNLLHLKLEIHEFTSKEFISMIEKKQNNVGQEIVKNNIILYGSENYYNLISKWMKK